MSNPVEPPRAHPILTALFLPFVLVADAVRWVWRGLGRVLGAVCAAIGRFVWALLLPVRWLCAQIGRGLTALGRWTWLVIGPPLRWLGRGLALVVAGVVGAVAWVLWALWQPFVWLWRAVGPTVRASWRLATRIAAACWRGLRAVALFVYIPFRPVVGAVAATARAVRASYRTVADSLRGAVGLPRRQL